MTSANQAVLTDVDQGIARIRFNRPDALNAINLDLARGFLAACQAIEKREDVRVVVLSGEGKGFMAGGDVAEMHAALPNAEALLHSLLDCIGPALLILTNHRAPVLASLHGPVAGAGVGIALAADLAIAADDTRINLAYARIGASPDAGVTWLLPRLVGLRRAMAMTMLPETFKAEDALQLGLVNWVVPRVELQNRTDVLAKRLAGGPAQALGFTKKLLREAYGTTFEAQMATERSAIGMAARTRDFAEGVGAFVAKRNAAFEGR